MRTPLISLALLGLTSSPALADGGFYAKAFGGLSSLQGNSLTLGGTVEPLSYDSGALAGGALGYDYANSPFRAEVEFAYRSGDATDLAPAFATEGDFASTSLMVNGYYVFDTGTKWKPYAGVGIGLATEIDFDLATPGGAQEFSDSGAFAAQAILGAEYAISDRVSLYGEARYFTTSGSSLTDAGGSVLDADYETIDLLAGVTLRF